jgi:hypothetical protein
VPAGFIPSPRITSLLILQKTFQNSGADLELFLETAWNMSEPHGEDIF